jgi:hypothetical protein
MTIDLTKVSQAWTAFHQVVDLHIENDDDFHRVHALADALADAVGDDVKHHLYPLFAIVMDLIDNWEANT